MENLIRIHWTKIFIFCLWILFCAPYIFHNLLPFPSKYLATFFPPWNAEYVGPVKNGAMPDVITQIYPWKKITIDSWKNGNIPLWNPYSFSGTVHAGNYQTAVFSPINILFSLFPFPMAWSAMILLQPLLAAFSMHILLKVLGRSSVAITIGSTAFMFCGFIVVWMAYGTLGYAALFLPLIVAFIFREYRQHQFLNLVGISGFTAFSFFSGHFQISLYVFFTAIFISIIQAVMTKKVASFIRVLICLVCGLGISAPQLSLTYDTYRQSVRSSDFLKGEVIPWNYLVTLFSPDFYGNPVTRNDWYGHYAEWASYIGIIPLLLSLLAIIHNRNREKYIFILISVVSLLFAYQTPLVDLMFNLKIPVISTSAASRIIVIFSFALATLSAYGLDDLLECWKKRQFKSVNILILISLVALVGTWVYLYLRILPPDRILIARRNLVLPTILIFIGGLIFSLGRIKSKFTIFLGLGILVIITGFDLNRYSTKWMPADSSEYLYPKNKMISFLTEHTGNTRIFGNLGGEVCNMYKLQCIEGYDAIYQGRYGEFINFSSKGTIVPNIRSVVQIDKNGKYTDNVLHLLGVKYIVHRISDGQNIWAFPVWNYDPNILKSVYRDANYEIFEFLDAYPRTFLASDYRISTGDKENLDLIFTSKIDPKNTLILETEPSEIPREGRGSAEIINYTPNSVTISTKSSVSKLLFISDVYSDGWNAKIDGQPAEILRADFDYRAVSLNPGNHIIEFIYSPISLKVGFYLMLISIIIIFLIEIINKKYENWFL